MVMLIIVVAGLWMQLPTPSTTEPTGTYYRLRRKLTVVSQAHGCLHIILFTILVRMGAYPGYTQCIEAATCTASTLATFTA